MRGGWHWRLRRHERYELVSFLFNGDGAHPDKLMLVMVVTPVTVITVPVAVMFMVPIVIVPVMIPTVVVGHCGERSAHK